MAAQPGRPGRRRRCGSRGSPPPAANSSAHPEARSATAPAGDRTACPAGTRRVSAVTLATDRITGSAGDRDVPPDVDSLAHKLPEITAMASGKQAGSGPATPHLLVNGIPRIRRKGPGAGNCASHHPAPAGAPAPRSHSPAQPAQVTGTAGDLERRWRLTVGGPSSSAKPLRPPPRPIPATNAPAATAIRAYRSEHQSPGRQPVLSSGPGYERCRRDRGIGGDRPGPGRPRPGDGG